MAVGRSERERESLAEPPRQRREARGQSREHQDDFIWTKKREASFRNSINTAYWWARDGDIAFLLGHKMKGLPGCMLDLESYIAPLRL